MSEFRSLQTLLIKAREEVYTLLSGNNFSKLHGEGYDLSEIREYQMGDDVRKINWIITAKMNKPYIKELHADRELSVVVATMMDSSLHFGYGNDKQKKLTEVAALLGYSAYQNGDLFTGVSYQQKESLHTPPTKHIYLIEEFVKRLFRTNTLGTKLSYDQHIEDIFKRVDNKSLIFIIGDFLQEVDLSLLAQRHEVIVIIIRDRVEENPLKLGEVILKDPSNQKEMSSFFGKRSIESYLKHLKINDMALNKHFSRYNIKYSKIYTDEDAVVKLMHLFA